MKNNIKKIVTWCLAIFFGFAAIVYLSEGGDSTLSGLLAVLFTAVVVPINSWQIVLQQFLKGKLKIIVAVILAVLTFALYPVEEPALDPTVPSGTTAPVVETTESSPPTQNNTTATAPNGSTNPETTAPTTVPTQPTETPAVPSEPTTSPTESVHIHNWLDATCTLPKSCSTCGATEGPPLGHSYTSTVINPTCTEQGYITYTCSRCNDQYIEETAALGHNYLDATCTDARTCSRCNLASGNALGHSFINGVCERCGDATTTVSTFSIHFIDVGQADAALVECDGHYMLIDGGNKADSNKIYSVLKKTAVRKLDIVVGTHAHEDHIGGLAGAFNYTTADLTLCPVTSFDTKAFEDFARYASLKGGGITVPQVGNTYLLGSATVTILGVNAGSDPNNSSIILRIDYGETSFLFTGDAEYSAEKAVLNSGVNLSATVLKVGHHGSETSTNYSFLREIMPQYAVISVGDNNNYGHPTENTLSRLRDADVKLFRTDMQGDIYCISDGKNVTFSVSRNAGADVFGGVGNNSTQINPTPGPTEPAPTDPPTTEPNKPDKLQIVSWPETIGRNETGTVTIKGKANTKYTITVYYKSGPSSADGLEAKTSNADGHVSWTWKVGGRTTPGTYKIVVEGNGETVTVEFTVTE